MTTLRKGQVRLGPQTWAIIREAYLSGVSGASLAETYGCSLGTIRYRAVREGWRRCDAHGSAPPATEASAGADEAMSPEELTELAIGAAGRALRAGRPSEAAAYIRVVEALQRLTAPDGPRPGDLNYIHPAELERRATELRARAPEILKLIEEKCGGAGAQVWRPDPPAS